MTRQELKEIILRVIERVGEDEAPAGGCIYKDAPDDPCDATTFYAIGEEG